MLHLWQRNDDVSDEKYAKRHKRRRAVIKETIRARILEAALDLFHQKGYNRVSVDEIVERAQTSKGGFYHNFKSKDALLYEIHNVFISYVLAQTKKARASSTSPVEQLSAMLYAFTNVFEVYMRHITVFYNEVAYLPEQFEGMIHEKRTQYRRLIEEVIDEGKVQGVFRSNLSTTITTMAIIGMVNWTYKWYRHDGELTMTQITDYFNDVILRGIVSEQQLSMLDSNHLKQL